MHPLLQLQKKLNWALRFFVLHVLHVEPQSYISRSISRRQLACCAGGYCVVALMLTEMLSEACAFSGETLPTDRGLVGEPCLLVPFV